MPSAKDLLAGRTLAGGWKVVRMITKAVGESGGAFSTGYIVESDTGRLHFLKAIDFEAALRTPDPARALQFLTEAFNLERDILQIGMRLSHVVKVVTDGTEQVTLPGPPMRPPETAQYLILELAEESLRQMASASRRLPMSGALAALHNIANGLRQLHREQVAHQDMKPSNALRFADGLYKVCDVGRASMKGRAAPHDGFKVAGDPAYAPPELLSCNDKKLSCRWSTRGR